MVLSAKKIHGRNFKPHEGTKVGASIGGLTGAVGGAAAGGFTGLVAASFGHASTPALIAAVLGGSAIGAVIIGGVGAAAGAGLGYMVDVSKQNANLYRYVIKPDGSDKPITVKQYSSLIPANSRVHILERDDVIFIKSKQ